MSREKKRLVRERDDKKARGRYERVREKGLTKIKVIGGGGGA